MRVPLSWLAEYVDLPAGSTPEDVHAALVKVGLEEEDLHRFEVSGPVVVGQVLEATPEPQSNGKTINWCQVRVEPGDGPDAVRGIVCGAHNFSVGDKVVVSLPGAVLPGPFPISARKTYGHISDGMIASVRELGLGDEHDGILVLSTLGLDPELGTDAIALLGLDDAAVEVNVTPDRGYAFSIRGIAREYAHSTGVAFRDPAAAVEPVETNGAFSVTIDDRAPLRGVTGVSVFESQVVRGIDPSLPTPPWMSSRLLLAGIRSISLPVDITNYVMIELGQPLHGYDLDALTGGIIVRRATAGETFETLDGKVRTLDEQDLLVTDESGPIGLAGVMGGASTEMNGSTRNVLIEAANWEPVTIARTARRHKLPSEAAKRYERGVDPAIARIAVSRVARLLVELAGGSIDDLGSSWNRASAPQPIELPARFVDGVIGVDYTDEEVSWALTEIGATLTPSAGGLTVTPPSWRPDLTDKWTLAEEVARLVGYDRIPSVLPVAPPGRGLTREQRLRRSAAQVLAANGLTEVQSYPFVSRSDLAAFSSVGDAVAAVRLANPLDATTPFLRRSLIPGLIQTAQRNSSRGLTDVALYEVGTVFKPAAGIAYGVESLPPIAQRPSDEVLDELNDGLPPQPRNVGILISGDLWSKQPGQAAEPAGWRDALTAVQQLGTALRVRIEVGQATHAGYHPGRTARLFVRHDGHDVGVGYAGELLPALVAEAHLSGVVAVAEVNLDALIGLSDPEVGASEIHTHSAATQDLSLVVTSDVAAGDVLAAVIEGAGALLERAELVDDYRGAGIETGLKSLTFALRFRAPDRTLTAAEASEAKLSGMALARERFGATLRD